MPARPLGVTAGVTQVWALLEHWERLCVPSLESPENRRLPCYGDTALSCAPSTCATSQQATAGRVGRDPAWVGAGGSPTMAIFGILRKPNTGQGREHCGCGVLAELATAPAEG